MSSQKRHIRDIHLSIDVRIALEGVFCQDLVGKQSGNNAVRAIGNTDRGVSRVALPLIGPLMTVTDGG